MKIPVALVALALLVGVVAPADAQGRRPAPRPAGRSTRSVVAPVYVTPYLSPYPPAPLPYAFYYDQALRQRMQQPPPATQSFHGNSPRCPRFFCEEGRP